MSAQLFIALIKETYGFDAIFCDDEVLEVYSPEQCNIPLCLGVIKEIKQGYIKKIIDTHLKMTRQSVVFVMNN